MNAHGMQEPWQTQLRTQGQESIGKIKFEKVIAIVYFTISSPTTGCKHGRTWFLFVV